MPIDYYSPKEGMKQQIKDARSKIEFPETVRDESFKKNY